MKVQLFHHYRKTNTSFSGLKLLIISHSVPMSSGTVKTSVWCNNYDNRSIHTSVFWEICYSESERPQLKIVKLQQRYKRIILNKYLNIRFNSGASLSSLVKRLKTFSITDWCSWVAVMSRRTTRSLVCIHWSSVRKFNSSKQASIFLRRNGSWIKTHMSDLCSKLNRNQQQRNHFMTLNCVKNHSYDVSGQ